MRSKVWDEITNQFPIWNGWAAGDCELVSNVIPHDIMDVITYPCGD